MSARRFHHAAHGIRAAGQGHVRAELFREVSLVGAARNPDHRIGSPGLGQLHVNLSRDSQAHHDDGLPGKNIDAVVAVHAGGRDLDERRNVAIDRIRQGVYVAARSHEVIRESAVGIASDERAVGAEVGLARAAIEAHAAVNGRVNDDAIAAVERGVSSVHHFADHFMAHDQRVADGDRAFVDVEIGPADAAMGHSDEDLVMSESGPLDFREAQIAGPSQDHSFHESCFRQSAALPDFPEPTARPGRVALTTSRNSSSVSKRLRWSEKSLMAATTRIASSSLN